MDWDLEVIRVTLSSMGLKVLHLLEEKLLLAFKRLLNFLILVIHMNLNHFLSRLCSICFQLSRPTLIGRWFQEWQLLLILPILVHHVWWLRGCRLLLAHLWPWELHAILRDIILPIKALSEECLPLHLITCLRRSLSSSQKNVSLFRLVRRVTLITENCVASRFLCKSCLLRRMSVPDYQAPCVPLGMLSLEVAPRSPWSLLECTSA